ncbi:PAS domain-containing protein [Mucilaginibacter sp. RB4R14]|uniref:PAS domain-containing protein n=1 Tax=Mucilaginibacter aurantiaciroseus TaxID=2949308 RepID=UPI002091BEA4|nr:PAS domain-containing protein [Mucilaginibacter aurantiaciroseus]MCO5934629.1 PAS domain-containing protein [Mucilaginibacter aurantiaciroseus]
MEDQPFLGYLQRVYRTGKPFNSCSESVNLLVGGKLQTYYYKFTYQPMCDTDGNVYGVVAINTNVTELERAKQSVEESKMALLDTVTKSSSDVLTIGVPYIVEEGL